MSGDLDNFIFDEHNTSKYKPVILRLSVDKDVAIFNWIKEREPAVTIYDQIKLQLIDLIKCQNPDKKFAPAEYDSLILNFLGTTAIEEYGVWVYYPWNNSLVHLLDEGEFVQVRTNRNQHKITKEEQLTLRSKKIGIIGLSVGQSIALTLAMERTCGEMRLADFDQLELSNMNRIRTGIHNLGIPKVILAAREIAEIDPFLKVEIYSNGINKDNIHDFFTKDGNLDLLVEVCDDINIKISSRFKARTLAIPVIMDTNDRGMIDVERFDLAPQRSIFHGLIDGFINESYDEVVINDSNRTAILFSLVDFNSLSDKMKYSMSEIGKSISNWPQLASSVVLGGAITTHLCSSVLLNHHQTSGRYYVDLDLIFGK